MTRDAWLIITLLIFASPAELGLATPLVVIAGIACAGILFKGGIYLEELAKVRVIAFDKTGTFTVGRPEVTAVERFGDAADEDTLLRLAAAAERRSSHPLAPRPCWRARLGWTSPSHRRPRLSRGVACARRWRGAPCSRGTRRS